MFCATEVVKTIVQYLEDMDGDDEFWSDLELLFKFTCPKTERKLNDNMMYPFSL